jgi:hypothetical protein
VEIFPARNCGAVEPDLVVVKLGAVKVFCCAPEFCSAARRPLCGQKNHPPARTSRLSKIQNVGRERMFINLTTKYSVSPNYTFISIIQNRNIEIYQPSQT